MRGYGSILASLLAPIAPIYFGIFYLRVHSFMEFSLAGVAVTIGLIVMIVLVLRNGKPWLALLSHGVLILYWVIGATLIAAGA